MLRYILVFFVFLFFSCVSKEEKLQEEISKIPVSVEVVRFDKFFGQATPSDLPELKRLFPAFFPKKYPDSIWINRMKDTLQQQMQTEVLKIFPNEESIQKPLTPVFQHLKHYFKPFFIPRVYTVLSDVDYENKVIASDTLLIIGIDNYLGAQHEFYQGLPTYVSQNLYPSRLPIDVASVYSNRFVSKPSANTFLEKIIYFGKKLYIKNRLVPTATLAQIIGYTPEQYKWAEENETEMWRYFVEKELLFSTSPKLDDRFIKPAPFSKFYLEIDNESPGRIGRFIGWQIVRKFMIKNPAITLKQLALLDAQKIFEQSNYKPKK